MRVCVWREGVTSRLINSFLFCFSNSLDVDCTGWPLSGRTGRRKIKRLGTEIVIIHVTTMCGRRPMQASKPSMEKWMTALGANGTVDEWAVEELLVLYWLSFLFENNSLPAFINHCFRVLSPLSSPALYMFVSCIIIIHMSFSIWPCCQVRITFGG